MPIAKITGPGLTAIGFSVALLWGCVIGDRLLVRQAHAERARILREIRLLQQRDRAPAVPVSVPLPRTPPPVNLG